MQSGVERSVLHLEQIVRGSLNVLGNLVAVSGPEQEGAQDEHVQRAL